MEIQITDKSKESLLQITSALMDKDLPLMSNLANLSRVFYEGFPNVSWAGFYLTDESKNALYLGPFQGPIACTRIPFSKGVCGACATSRKTVLVENVHTFPGHIACSSATNSELVVPILKGGEVVGVIDLDSNLLSNFTVEDASIAEAMAVLIAELF